MKSFLMLFLGAVLGLSSAWLMIQQDLDTLIISPDAVLPDGSRYYGEIVNSQFHGKGRLMGTDRFRYEGDFIEGLFSGIGELKYSNGDYVSGEFKQGKLNGKALMISNKGNRYEGEFKQDNFSGSGVFTGREGDIYTGQFVNHEFTGEGKYTDQDGNHYKGGFLDWKFHGKGAYTKSNGDVYEGEFQQGSFTGKGRFTDSNKNTYEGEFKDWWVNGQASYTTADGELYKGNFVDGVLNGKGEHKKINGEHYIGEFKDGYYQGDGVMIKENGDKYSGQFFGGMEHGKGQMEFFDSDAKVALKKGEWRYGNLLDPDDAANKKELRKKVETALYAQNELVAAALKQVQAGKKGEVEFYFLGLAGNGVQDVFLKEVQFVKNSFDEKFNTRNRSLLLINNKETMGKITLATSSSLKQVLQVLAEKMNTEEDILFLYMTSHGSKEHEFDIEQPGFDFPDLEAKQLAEIVKAQPIKWKVIAISACYSGGFIPLLKDENVLIMTSAMSTRQSFGCSDDSDMTYFGRAYFQDSLPSADSFQHAFDNAKILIKERELEYIKENPKAEHSNPQIWTGKNIKTYLQNRWPILSSNSVQRNG